MPSPEPNFLPYLLPLSTIQTNPKLFHILSFHLKHHEAFITVIYRRESPRLTFSTPDLRWQCPTAPSQGGKSRGDVVKAQVTPLKPLKRGLFFYGLWCDFLRGITCFSVMKVFLPLIEPIVVFWLGSRW